MAFVPAISVTARGGSTGSSLTGVSSNGRRLLHFSAGRRGVAEITTGRRSSGAPTMALDKTIGDTLVSDCKNKTLLALCEIAGVDLSAISGTFFAPSDSALARLPAGSMDWFAANPDVLRSILLRHVVPTIVVTTKQIKGVGYYEGSLFGGSLSYEGLGPVIKVGGQRVLLESSNRECSNGIIHAIDGVILPAGVTLGTSFDLPAPAALVGDSAVSAAYPTKLGGRPSVRAVGAASAPSTQGGRKAMGLMKQLPFWMYGPPFNAAKQEDLEPVSLIDTISSSVDYQVLPPGAVVVEPDQVSGDKLNPISGYSKYLGKAKRMVGGDAESKYAETLDKGM